jgi:hypothetical protein
MSQPHSLIIISLTQKIQHQAAATVEGCVTQGPPKDSSYMVFKLAGDAAVHGVVTAVVGPRRNFIE